MPATPQNRDIAATFAKGMAVLAAFDGRSAALTLAEIARRAGQDRAAARRGALTLVALGYLRQEGRAFSLTPKVLGPAGAYLQAHGVGRLVQPVLNHHAAEIGREITLATRDGVEVLLVAQSTVQDGPVSQGFTAGSRLPLVSTALGRMLLACEPQAEAEALVDQAPRVTHSADSLTDPRRIKTRIVTARAHGVARTDGEFEPGILGLAVPASAPGARAVVLGTSFPRGPAAEAQGARALAGLRDCAAELRRAGAIEML
ncbi:MAG TPA: IclR family transcriptional regulator [Rhodobacteraceae bacterium]|nr:IclR family transcriptional regulator [Paracoccaceae bacterium]